MQLDKLLHLFVGISIAATLAPVFGYLLTGAIVFLIAAAKEIYDSYHKENHTPDGYDLLATIIGGGAYLGWIWLISRSLYGKLF